MKYLISIAIILVLIFSYVFMQKSQQDLADMETPDNIQSAELTGTESESLAAEAPSVQGIEPPLSALESVMDPKERSEKVAEIKRQMDALIVEYDANLRDVEARATIQNKLDQLIEQYNELVLPEALEKLSEN